MPSTQAIQPPIWFWVIGVGAVIWNAIGLAGFVVEIAMSERELAALPAAHRALIEGTPTPIVAAYGIAVIGGLLGSVALLLRHPWATPLLVASLAAIVVQMAHAIFFSPMISVLGPISVVMPLVIVVIAIALVVATRVSTRRGWIRAGGARHMTA
jgi:hypothetical protein